MIEVEAQEMEMTKHEAVILLVSSNLVFARRDGIREYWKRTDGGNDVFLDHSATITRVGKNNFHVSNFMPAK